MHIMQSEKQQWDGACDLYDHAIELCEQAIERQPKEIHITWCVEDVIQSKIVTIAIMA